MKSKSMFNLENKYYYGFSRTFWHFIIGLSVLGLVISVIVIAYSLIPASKENVVKQMPAPKEPYPNQAEVTLNELLAALPKEQTAVKTEEAVVAEEDFTPPPSKNDIKQDSTGLKEFERQFARLNSLFPYTKFTKFLQGEGEYVYIDRVKYNITKSEDFRRWVPTSEPFKERLKKETSKNEFNSYPEKSKLVNQYYNILKEVNDDSKANIAKDLIKFKDENLSKTISSLEILSRIMGLYDDGDKEKAFNLNSGFLNINPNDGTEMLLFETEILPKFDKKQRYRVSWNIKNEYRNYYNNNIPGISENTTNFIKYIPNIKVDQQALALKEYYNLYRGKNIDRVSQIQEIEDRYAQQVVRLEAEYQMALLDAEAKYALKKEKKGMLRKTSLLSIGITVGAVLFITIILLLLSMIRNINKLALAMLENTNEMKNNNNQNA